MKLTSKTLAIFAVAMSITSLAWARVTIDPDFTGTLIVTLSNGEVSLYESGDVLPEIPAGASIEIFDGSLSLHTETGDQIQLGCFGNQQSVGGGSSADLTCGATSGMLKIDGLEYPISGSPSIADPTAELDPTGVPSDDDPAPDSRSIQASTVS